MEMDRERGPEAESCPLAQRALVPLTYDRFCFLFRPRRPRWLVLAEAVVFALLGAFVVLGSSLLGSWGPAALAIALGLTLVGIIDVLQIILRHWT